MINKASGGGVMIYVVRSLKFKKITNMSEHIENVCECISIEIDMNIGKNVVITCLYRTPGTSIEALIEYLEKNIKFCEQK